MEQNLNKNRAILEDLISSGDLLSHDILPIGAYDEEHPVKNLEEYQTWLATCLRFIRVHYPDELDGFEKIVDDGIFPYNHNILLGKLRAIRVMPEMNPHLRKNDNSKININNYNSQTQSQTQSQQIAIQLFLEAIKDELTGKQTKELKQIIEDHKDEPEKIKPKLLEKLESFGIGVLSGIVGNILTNPQILSGFMG